MKVIHLISGGDTGGARTHVYSLLKYLGQIIDVQLVCFRGGDFADGAAALGIPTMVLDGGFLPNLAALKKLIRAGEYDLVHCHGSMANVMGAMLKASVHVPVISTVHSDYRLDYLGRPFARAVYGTLNIWALHQLDYRVCVSDPIRQRLIDRGFEPNRLFSIYNGLDFSHVVPKTDRAAYFAQFGYTVHEGDVIAGIAARLDPVKDIPTLIRAVALVCILVIHFNAAVTGYFTLPSKLFGSVLPFNIYLGDFGSSLFFMVSGAALQYTSPGQGREPLNLARFYQKRAKAVYPMFWLAWCIFFPIRFVAKPGYYAAAKTPSLLLTVLGLDNFAQAAGWVTMDFACVGEWFLGSILFLYLLFPLLRWGLRKQPLLTWVVVLATSLPVHYMGWDARLVAIHIPEFLLGMAFVHWKRPARLGVLAGCAVLLFTPAAADGKGACALFSAAAFILLAALGGCIHWVPLQNACALLSKYSYAVFLTHHVIILRLVENFDLAAMTRRDTALLFGVYLLAVAAASAALFRLDAWVRSSAVKLAAKPE